MSGKRQGRCHQCGDVIDADHVNENGLHARRGPGPNGNGSSGPSPVVMCGPVAIPPSKFYYLVGLAITAGGRTTFRSHGVSTPFPINDIRHVKAIEPQLARELVAADPATGAVLIGAEVAIMSLTPLRAE